MQKHPVGVPPLETAWPTGEKVRFSKIFRIENWEEFFHRGNIIETDNQ